MIASGWKTWPFGRVRGTWKATPGHTFSIGGTFVFFGRCSTGDGAAVECLAAAAPDEFDPFSSVRPPTVAPPMATATAAAASAIREYPRDARGARVWKPMPGGAFGA